MKRYALIGIVSLLFSSFVSASDVYYPPERLNCKLNRQNQLRCFDFNREFFIEDSYTANLKQHEFATFLFNDAEATFSQGMNEANIRITYINADMESVTLKTKLTSLKPDLSSNNWLKTASTQATYLCTAGYLSCGIVN